MDANGHRFWMLVDAGDFDLSDGGCRWTGTCLQLAGGVALGALAGQRSAAILAANLPPVAVGAYGDHAWHDPAHPFEFETGAILAATGPGPATPIFPVPEGAQLRDMAVDADGVLHILGDLGGALNGLVLADLRGRWRDPVVIPLPGAPDRVAGPWVLDRASGRLWREAGVPLPDLARRSYAEHIFRPDPEYTDLPRLREAESIPLDGNEVILDCAARNDGLLAVLVAGTPQSRRCRILFVTPLNRRISVEVPLRGFASSIGFVSDTTLALTYPGTKRAVVLDVALDEGGTPVALAQEARRYPLAAADSYRICRGTAQPAAVAVYTGGLPGTPRPLHPLSLPDYRAEGQARGAFDINAGTAGTVWHRVVVEGDFPPGTGAVVSLQAADSPDDLAAAPVHAHHIGATDRAEGAPRLCWLDRPSELPLHPGLLGQPPVQDRTGCFSALIQSTGTVAREVAGRYLRVRVQLFGGGQSTPAIAAIRVWGGRFSLVKKYLPEVFRAPEDPALRDVPGPAHPLDFLDRFTAGFEHSLTRFEDEVVAAPQLTDPMAAPEAALDWLASWVGLTLKSGLSVRQRRVMLANALRLHRRRGTMPGLRLALDIAGEGALGAGGIVTFEDFRLRRVMATILGADLGAEFDPLLAGPVESGNSFVGLTLTLGDAAEIENGAPKLSARQQTEIAALLRAPTGDATADDVRAFFAELAWRVTVLVHHEVTPERFALIRDVAAQLVPAHVSLRVERASRSLIIGLYALLGVDTYLKARPGAEPIILNQSQLGGQDFLLSLPSLDPSIDYGGAS